jgi:hypothetical protein
LEFTENFEKGEMRLLSEILCLCTGFEASDERDRIYAFLGLADPGYGVVPDYSTQNDSEQVLLETTQRIILFEDSLDVLELLWSQSNRQSHSDLFNIPADLVGMPISTREDASFLRVENPARLDSTIALQV